MGPETHAESVCLTKLNGLFLGLAHNSAPLMRAVWPNSHLWIHYAYIALACIARPFSTLDGLEKNCLRPMSNERGCNKIVCASSNDHSQAGSIQNHGADWHHFVCTLASVWLFLHPYGMQRGMCRHVMKWLWQRDEGKAIIVYHLTARRWKYNPLSSCDKEREDPGSFDWICDFGEDGLQTQLIQNTKKMPLLLYAVYPSR